MSRKQYAVEAFERMLQEAEVHLSVRSTIKQAAKKLGIKEQTCYRWRKQYGGLRTDRAHRLRELERENARLKKLVRSKPWISRSCRPDDGRRWSGSVMR